MDKATAKPRIANSNPTIATNSSYAQSLVICAKAILLTFARTTVALERAAYRHDRRKISDAMLSVTKRATGWEGKPHHVRPEDLNDADSRIKGDMMRTYLFDLSALAQRFVPLR
jgi:hypothetical protein